MTKRLAATVLVIFLVLPGCPVASLVGTWGLYDCDGNQAGTVRFLADGSVNYDTVDGSAEGTWTEIDGQVDFVADGFFDTNGRVTFSGSLINPDRIEGSAINDAGPSYVCAVLLR